MLFSFLLIHLEVVLLQDGRLDLPWLSRFLGLCLSLGRRLRLLDIQLRRRSDSLERCSDLILNPGLSLDLDFGLGLEQSAHPALLLAHKRH